MAELSDPPGRVRVLVVDDDALVRSGLTMILGGDADVEIVGEAGDGQEAIQMCQALRPDVVLMDIRMPRMDGLEATRRLVHFDVAPKVIVLTTFDADEYVARALVDGASGFLLKDTPPAAIVDAVHKVADGDPMLSPSVTAQLIDRLRSSESGASDERAHDARGLVQRLTERELEVALCVGQGRSNADIASELFMSVATVKAHVSRVLAKLEATNRVQIAIRMHDADLI